MVDKEVLFLVKRFGNLGHKLGYTKEPLKRQQTVCRISEVYSIESTLQISSGFMRVPLSAVLYYYLMAILAILT